MLDYFPTDYFTIDYFGDLADQSMQILPPEDIAVLKIELAKSQYQGLGDLAVLDLLYAPTMIQNPTPQGQAPKPFLSTDLIGAIDPSRRTSIVPILGDIAPLILTQDRYQIGQWGASLLELGFLQSSDIGEISAVLTATIPDPTWSATVPGPAPAFTLFAGKRWAFPDGSHTDSVQLEDITAARTS